MANRSPDSLWDFSLAVYRSEAVQNSCLALQDRHGLDVNILLFCCWLAARNCAIDDTGMAAVLADTSEWHSSVVVPLRAIRRGMKGGVGQAPAKPTEILRARIKTLELEAEQMEQRQLEAAVARYSTNIADTDAPVDTAMANLQTYFSAQQLKPGRKDAENLDSLVSESMRLDPIGAGDR